MRPTASRPSLDQRCCISETSSRTWSETRAVLSLPSSISRRLRSNCSRSVCRKVKDWLFPRTARPPSVARSEEHTSELQSREKFVCRLLLEKKTNEDKSKY